MAINRRRMNPMNTYNAPKVEVVKIEPPKIQTSTVPPSSSNPHQSAPRIGGGKGLGFLTDLFKNIKFDAEDILLLGLILLFLNNDDEDYAMMVPALIYIFLG